MRSGEIYNHESVAVDGEAFAGCEFRDCRLIYAGGEPPSFAECTFVGCDWKFDDAATRTLSYLKLVWSLGGKASVQALIKDITVSR